LAESQTTNEVRSGFVYTFYSYKGGVGRSMALVNIGVSMALSGHRILLVDWDLEAPGLEVFFRSTAKMRGDPTLVPGIVDLLEARQNDVELDWSDCLLTASFLNTSVDIISAGRRSPDYRQRVQALDWSTLYDEHRIGNFIDQLRTEWRGAYDFVLIDSRTGITDIGDICTVLLPDALVLLFVSNHQNIEGVKAVMERSVKARRKLPVNRNKLVGVPLSGRDEADREYDKAMEWRQIYADELGYLFHDWLPKDVSPSEALNKLFIPYVTNWSFGERIPVLESRRELQDPTTIGAAYQRVATLLSHRLDWLALDSKASLEELQGTRVELRRAQTEVRDSQEMLKKLQKQRVRATRRSLALLAAVLGVMGAIGIPAYQDYTTRTKVAEGITMAAAAKLAVTEHYYDSGRLVDSNEAAGLPKEPISGAFVESVKIGMNGRIFITYNQQEPELSGRSLELRPTIEEDSPIVSWSCISNEIASKYLPANCVQATRPNPEG
jgi:Mrp family chromosome partitioning ATPase/ribosomal protein L29